MPLVPMKAILDATEKYNYAQGAFNVNAVCRAKAVIEVHEMFRSAAILQGADLANAFMGGRTDFTKGTLEDKKKGALNIANAVKKYAEASPTATCPPTSPPPCSRTTRTPCCGSPNSWRGPPTDGREAICHRLISSTARSTSTAASSP